MPQHECALIWAGSKSGFFPRTSPTVISIAMFCSYYLKCLTPFILSLCIATRLTFEERAEFLGRFSNLHRVESEL
jgi:hypothetical protein